MCVICTEISKKAMTLQEVANAYHEMEVPKGHANEILEELKKHYGLTEISKELTKDLISNKGEK